MAKKKIVKKKKTLSKRVPVKKIKRKVTALVKDMTNESYSLQKNGITQSLMSYYMKCKRLFLFKINKWESEGYNHTTSFGSLVHDILAFLYKGAYNEIVVLKKESIADCLNYLIDLYEHEQEDAGKLDGIDLQEWEWEKAVTSTVLEAYIKYYPEDFKDKKFTEVETELVCDLFDTPIKIKLDGKYEIKGGKNWLMEHKTKSRITENTMMKRLSFDFQNLTYLTVCEKIFKQKIDGVLYNIIRKPGIRKRVNENLVDYKIRLEEDLKKRPDFYFMRYEIPYTDKDKSNYICELQSVLSDIGEMGPEKSSDDFYKNPYACESPFPCNFLDACASGKMSGYNKRKLLFPELSTLNEVEK